MTTPNVGPKVIVSRGCRIDQLRCFLLDKVQVFVIPIVYLHNLILDTGTDVVV